jgi:hypothetical protein
LQAAKFGEETFDGAMGMGLRSLDGGQVWICDVKGFGGFSATLETPGGADDFEARCWWKDSVSSA